jgi:hypothetical protein
MSDDSGAERTPRRLAYEAFDAGDLAASVRHFGAAIEQEPDDPSLHYMLGLAHKYQRQWAQSLAANLRASVLQTQFDEASAWNAAIAATALGDWTQARSQWRRCGIAVPGESGRIDGDFGVACVRLNPWGRGEVVYARRVDPVRARLINVPLPESGHRYGDLVLHDGAVTGERVAGERRYGVFNALQRLERSEFRTHVVFVESRRRDGIEALEGAKASGIGHVEDWTASLRNLCLRCSYGSAHTHAAPGADPAAWEPARTIGVAADSRASLDRLLAAWESRWHGRRVESVTAPEFDPPAPEPGHVWWRSLEDDDADEAGPATTA